MLLDNGDGTFQAAVNYAAGPNPASVAVGDFNGDGKLDLAVATSSGIFNPVSSNNVSVFLGNGDGTFQAAMLYAAGDSPNSVTVGDFNGDGKPISRWRTMTASACSRAMAMVPSKRRR